MCFIYKSYINELNLDKFNTIYIVVLVELNTFYKW